MLFFLVRPLLALTIVLSSAHAVLAADQILMMPIKAALDSVDGRAMIEGDVKFFFGKNRPVRIAHQYGNFITNNKARVFGRSTGEACNLTFLNALEDLQKKARSVGGNAVIGVVSYFRRREVSSDDSYECNLGAVVAGVALKGDLVKVD
jgi:uncharacterized protein YbjQ (UPF0145 family)